MDTKDKLPKNPASTKYARLSFVFVIVLLISNYFEMPFTVRLTNWRLNDVCAAIILVALPIVTIWFATTLRHGLLVITTALIGIALSIPIGLGFLTVSLPHLLYAKDDQVTLLDSVSIGSDRYRLYSVEPGGFGMPTLASLRKERETPFGVVYVKTLWTDPSYCCYLELQLSRGSRIDIIDKTEGNVIKEFDVRQPQ